VERASSPYLYESFGNRPNQGRPETRRDHHMIPDVVPIDDISNRGRRQIPIQSRDCPRLIVSIRANRLVPESRVVQEVLGCRNYRLVPRVDWPTDPSSCRRRCCLLWPRRRIPPRHKPLVFSRLLLQVANLEWPLDLDHKRFHQCHSTGLLVENRGRIAN
jgi:hypothetical protein